MRIKIASRKLDFDPVSIEWRHQSSPLSRFGLWHSNRGPVFVKRFREKPPGWRLLETVRGKKLHNTPEVLALAEHEGELFAFFKWLEGDILSQILQKDRIKQFFGPNGLSKETRTLLTISIYGTIANLHRMGFWYPDLDFKNVFVTGSGSGCSAYLIDLDSCVGFGEPAHPDQVSQRYWEGLITTYREAGNPFLKKGLNEYHRDISAHGRSLNQSMLCLFAYDVQRLGKVPLEAPLFPPLVSPQNPISQEVIRLHAGWLQNRNQEPELHSWLADYLKVSPDELSKTTSRLTPPLHSRLGSLISRLFGN